MVIFNSYVKLPEGTHIPLGHAGSPADGGGRTAALPTSTAETHGEPGAKL